MRKNIRQVGGHWLLDTTSIDKSIVCQCGLPGSPVVSQFNVFEIAEDQIRDTRVLANRYSIIDIFKKNKKDLRILEIGTAAGDFAQMMVDSLDIKRLVLIDPFHCSDVMSRGEQRFTEGENYDFVVKRFSTNKNVEVIIGRSEDRLPEFIPLNSKEKFNFIYIDSNHSFHNVYNEILYASQMLMPDGIIGIDDFSMGVDHPFEPYEVMQAVSTFLYNNPEWKVRYFTLGAEGLSNIYLSKLFEGEHPIMKSTEL